MVAVLIFVTAVRLRLASAPLERDEGEFAYLGQQLLQGIPPYLSSFSMKPPGIFAAYASIMLLFGETARGIHLGLAVVNALSIITIFFLARRLRDSFAAAATSIAFAILTLSQSVFGCFAHATNFVVLFTLFGFLLLLKALDGQRPLLIMASGVSFGLAYTMKQQGVFLITFAAAYLVLSQLRSHDQTQSRLARIAALIAGIAMPLGVMLLLLYHSGALESYWFWTMSYPRELVANMNLEAGLKNLTGQFFIMNASLQPFLLMALIGIVALLRDPVLHNKRLFIGGIALFSFIAVCPGFYFTPHYFVLMAPPLALFVGVGMSFVASLGMFKLRPWLGCAVGSALLIVAFSVFMVKERDYLFDLTPTQVSRSIYGLDPFPESVEIARYLRERTVPSDRVAVIGSEPQIYFYAGRHAATGFNQMYGLMEQHPYALGMQQQMIDEITAANPRFMVYVKTPNSWALRETASQLIFTWADWILATKYRQVGVIDIVSFEQTLYRYDDDARNYAPRSPVNVLIYERHDP